MKDVKELRVELAAVFKALKDGTIKPGQANELANVAGKMINSARAQISYYALRKEIPKIKFLEEGNVRQGAEQR